MKVFPSLVGIGCALSFSLAFGKVYLTLEQVTEKTHPGAERKARTLYLSEEQLQQVEEIAGTKISGRVIHTQQLLSGDKVLGTLYLDRHRVRTLPETLGILISPEGKVLSVDVLTFSEPELYKARENWLAQFTNTHTESFPRYKHNIDGISGATLTGRAVTDAVRRALALHQVTTKSSQ